MRPWLGDRLPGWVIDSLAGKQAPWLGDRLPGWVTDPLVGYYVYFRVCHAQSVFIFNVRCTIFSRNLQVCLALPGILNCMLFFALFLALDGYMLSIWQPIIVWEYTFSSFFPFVLELFKFV